MNWDFIKANELQIRNDMQQEPGKTLIGDIYLSFLSSIISIECVLCARHQGYDDS